LPGGIGRLPPTSGRPRSGYRVVETGPWSGLGGQVWRRVVARPITWS